MYVGLHGVAYMQIEAILDLGHPILGEDYSKHHVCRV